MVKDVLDLCKDLNVTIPDSWWEMDELYEETVLNQSSHPSLPLKVLLNGMFSGDYRRNYQSVYFATLLRKTIPVKMYNVIIPDVIGSIDDSFYRFPLGTLRLFFYVKYIAERYDIKVKCLNESEDMLNVRFDIPIKIVPDEHYKEKRRKVRHIRDLLKIVEYVLERDDDLSILFIEQSKILEFEDCVKDIYALKEQNPKAYDQVKEWLAVVKDDAIDGEFDRTNTIEVILPIPIESGILFAFVQLLIRRSKYFTVRISSIELHRFTIEIKVTDIGSFKPLLNIKI